MIGVTNRLPFSHPFSVHISRSTRLREMRRNSPFAVRARNAPKRRSHLVHMLEMVELARDTMASAHSPWGVHATAWVLGWASNTLLTPHRSRAQRSEHRFGRSWVVRRCRTVVCTSSSAARAAMGHWANMPPCPGITCHCLFTLGDHTHHHRSHTQRRRHHIRRFELRYGGVWW